MDGIDWNVVGAVAEALGALGVIGSLAYLGSQIRQNTQSNRIAARQNTTDQFVQFTRDLAGDPELARVFEEGRRGDTLDEADRRRFHYLNRQLCFNFSAQWSQREMGAISEDDWHESLVLMRHTWLAQPGSRAWWEANQAGASPGFRRFIETEVMPHVEASKASRSGSDVN